MTKKKRWSPKVQVFGTRELIVSSENVEAAKTDVEKLEIQVKWKKQILTGAVISKKELKDFDPSDKNLVARKTIGIILVLMRADYGYETVKSIFLNPYLFGGLAKEFAKDEDELESRVIEAQLIYAVENTQDETEEKRAVTLIKNTRFIGNEEKVRRISAYILYDLLEKRDSIGVGYFNDDRQLYYFFDKEEKMLMDLESNNFYCYVQDRYGIPKKDFQEIKDSIMTKIWNSKKKIEAHIFSYFDEKNFILYISDHDNGVYKLDGEKIEFVDNGTDGVFFEFNSDFSPIRIETEGGLKGARYFVRGKISKKTEGLLGVKEGREILGFDWDTFREGDSLLRRFLVDRTNFATEEEKNLDINDQKFLLVIYFFSLFFESLQTEKPILCFVGRKESGKSFIATSIGKILFGDRFQSRHCPDTINDFKTVIGENSYLVFDNLDHFVKSEVVDALCVTATGGTVEKRKLYTDHEVVKIRPHVFLVLTTREAKFKRDDLVSRLLLFNTKRIERPKSKSFLYKELKDNRNKIMEEVLLNSNLIVKCLKQLKRQEVECVSRIADWETFGKKIVIGFPWGLMFQIIMEKMNAEKDVFGLEDDYIYIILKHIIYEKEEVIEEVTAGELYTLLEVAAEELNIKDFTKRYKSSISVGKRIGQIKDELSREFYFELEWPLSMVRHYTIKPKVEQGEEEESG